MKTDDICKILSNNTRSGLIIKERDLLDKYARDETPGDYYYIPDAVYCPEDTEDINELLKVSENEEIPIIPRGAGTSRCGGALAIMGGVVLSLERMNKIIDIDEENMILEVEPGVITEEINNFLEDYGLFYPPDPASIDSCSIGGNIATNAGGARCLRYGLTRSYVKGLEVIFPGGKKEFFGGKFDKNATGYSLLNLIIGSEGTLGIITRILLRTIPIPKYSATLLVPFDKLENAAFAAFKVLSSGYIPSALEFMDKDAVEATAKYSEDKLPYQLGASFLIVEIDELYKQDVEDRFEKIGEIFLENGASDVFIAEQKYQREKIWKFRRSISESLDRIGIVLPEDVVVPRASIPEFVSYVKNLEVKYDTGIYTFGHIGDGNIHIDIIKRDKWTDGGKSIIEDILRKVTSLGGKISGEHGIGFTKKEYLHFSRSVNEIDLMRRVKRTIDPHNIMNPGKIFDINELQSKGN